MNLKCVFLLIPLLILSFPINPQPFFASDEQTPSGIPLSELEPRIDAYVQDYIGQTAAGASVLVMKNQEVVFSKGYGFADINRQIPMKPDDTIMEWGSVSKLFVYVAMMQLVEQEKLDLNQDIQSYLPDHFLTKLSYDEPITMRHLMHHTAGFEEYIYDLGFGSPDRVTTLEEGLKLAEPYQVYPPGQVVAYSNYSTSLAAFVIERIAGEPFYDYVEKNIFEPLDMNQTNIHPTFEGKEDLLKKKATGYSTTTPAEFTESDWFYMSMYPSGAINGTMQDLAAFADALLPMNGDGSPLFAKEETLDTFLSQSYTANDHASGIAHGFWEYAGASRGVTHGGNTTSFSSHFHLVPDEEFAVIILTNQAAEMDLNFGLTALLVGEKEQPTAREALPDTTELEGSFLAARRPHHGFIGLYFYLMPYEVTAKQANEIEVSYAGFKANYIQTSPYVFELSQGDTLFQSMKHLTLHVEDGEITQISTSISDYLPFPQGKTTPFLIGYMVLAICCVVFFFISPIILLIKTVLNMKRKQRTSRISKWHAILVLSGTATIINIIILAIRLLTNYDRAYSEVYAQVILNTVFSGIGLLSIICMARYWRKSRLRRIQKISYSATLMFTGFLIALLMIWDFYVDI